MTRYDFDVFTVRLPAHVIDRLRKQAEDNNLKPTEYARQLIIAGLDDGELLSLIKALERFAGRR